jgi:predicted amidohydrolase YtcJ
MRKTFTGGTVRTMDPAKPTAEVVVVRDGRILFAGHADEKPPDSEEQGEIYDLRGKVIIPGFIDAHLHFTQMVWELSLLDLSPAMDISELRERLSDSIKTRGSGGWIIGRRLPGSIFYEARERPGKTLEDITAGEPVIFGSADTHTALLNIKGVELLEESGVLEGLPEKLVERCGDVIILWETAAVRAWRWLEKTEKKCRETAFEDTVKALHSRGITGIYTFERLKDSRTISGSEACSGGLITAVGFYEDELEEILMVGPAAMGEGLVRGGLKLFIDGTLGSRTALLLEPYEGGDSCGYEVTPPGRLSELALRAARNGINLCLHAIGDGANRIALDLLESTSETIGQKWTGNRIEHIQLVHPDDLERFGELDVIASVQPIHLLDDWKKAEELWGRRCQRSYPLQSLLDKGARMAFGSDAPAAPVDPVRTIQVASMRRRNLEDPDKGLWVPGEKISVEDAILSHTRGSAYASGFEGETGIVREGCRADMVVLSANPFRSEEDLLKTEVVATIAGGKLVCGSEKLLKIEN